MNKLFHNSIVIIILITMLVISGGCCGGGSSNNRKNEANTEMLTVNVFLPSDEAADGIAGPAPAGVIISINGIESGVTDADGKLTIKVPSGDITVEAKLYPSNWGEAFVTLEPGEHRQIDIIMDEGKELSENSTLVIDQLQNGVLDRNFNVLTLRLLNRKEDTIVLNKIDWVSLLDPQGGVDTFVKQLFTLRHDGTLILNDVAAFRNILLGQSGKILLNVKGYDTGDRTHDDTLEFYISSYKVEGQLMAPPSNPSLNTAGISISANILNTDLVFNAVSDADGRFEFPLLPAGNLSFTSETFQSNKYYYGEGILVLDGNKFLTVNMLFVTDLVNGVMPFTVNSLKSSLSFKH